MTNEEFYNEVGILLGCEHHYKEPVGKYKSRWNNRKPGNGRFPGLGLVQSFGDIVIIRLYHPERISESFFTKEEALTYLKGVFQ